MPFEFGNEIAIDIPHPRRSILRRGDDFATVGTEIRISDTASMPLQDILFWYEVTGLLQDQNYTLSKVLPFLRLIRNLFQLISRLHRT